MLKRKKVLIVLSSLVFLITTILGNISVSTTSTVNASGSQVTPVSYYGKMVASGNSIIGSKTNAPMQVKGMSFFWSNWSGPYYNSATVDRMVDEFQCEILRVAYGIRDNGTPYNTNDEQKIREVIDASIRRGVYIIIDWHSHGAHLNPQAAKDFFGRMAQQYGSYDNVIFELYNEPVRTSWSEIKRYAEEVIPVIRQHSDNLIVVGTPTWSQDVDHAANDPINDKNVAYALHFYAGTHRQSLRNKANTALSRGIPLFVTEWGGVNADGDGGIDYNSTNEWLSWMDQHKISWCNWAINDKAESSSIFFPGGSLTDNGRLLKETLNNHARTAEWRNVQPPTSTTPPPTTPPPTTTPPTTTPPTTTPPTTPPNFQHNIPGTIQAESFSAMSGIQIEPCIEGGNNVGYIDSGDWMDYNVNVQTSGTYNVSFRVASLNGAPGAIQLREGNNILCTVDVPNTGDWQNWITVNANVNLQAGSKTLRIHAGNSAWNINWINFELAGTTPTQPPQTNFKYGDINGDNVVDSTDYILLRRYILEIINDFPQPNGRLAADVNNDGKIDSTDAILMRRYIMEIIDRFPAES
ncbi:UNVERIFIED_CONTAM: endoglucanase [Acetivibrio alkalicellulosi]